MKTFLAMIYFMPEAAYRSSSANTPSYYGDGALKVGGTETLENNGSVIYQTLSTNETQGQHSLSQ